MSEPQPGLGGNRVYSASGQGLGGTSNIYHMIHTRGRAADYDNWAYRGCAGWSFQDVLPYFQKLENQQDDTNPTAGKGGPINVINAKTLGSPISETFIEACVELGYPRVEDFNAQDFGAGWHHVDVKDGRRSGVRVGYLEPALGRPNVDIHTKVMATRLLFEGNRCVGVEYLQDGELKTVRANKEVIVSAGAIQSPKLLMLSGIGPADQLRRLEIEVRADLPGVGENFHDHPLGHRPIRPHEPARPRSQGQRDRSGPFLGFRKRHAGSRLGDMPRAPGPVRRSVLRECRQARADGPACETSSATGRSQGHPRVAGPGATAVTEDGCGWRAPTRRRIPRSAQTISTSGSIWSA